MSKIEKLRALIGDLTAERTALLAQPRDRAEIVGAVDALLAHAQQQGDDALRRDVARLAAGQPAELLRVRGLSVGAAGAAVVTVDLGPLLVALLGVDAVRGAVMGHVDALPEGLSTAARRLRLAEIDSELDTLGSEEEALILASEATGSPVARRADADPAAVLAP